MRRAKRTVYAIHGISAAVDRRRLTDYFLASASELERYLAATPRFVPLAAALAGDGNALSIDDGTRGAAAAARMARQRGHAVSLFVNPEQVESGLPHSLHLLSALVDRLSGTSYVFEGVSSPVTDVRERWALRARIKQTLSALTSETARIAMVEELADDWSVAPLALPEHLRPLDRRDLEGLLAAGVEIQNHGWSHVQHGGLSPGESAREVRAGREWLARELGVDAAIFAVPFGDALPAGEALRECTAWLTAKSDWPPGEIARGVFNRTVPRFASGPAAIRGRPNAARRVLGRWSARLRALLSG